MKVHKTSTITVRVEPSTKILAEKILHEVGLSPAEAVRLFYKQICLHHGLPFEVRLPNEETVAAIKEAKSGKGLVESKDLEELFKDLDDL